MTSRILVGHALDRLKDLPDKSVHCVITSPPYWGLRSYKGDAGMIGLEQTFDEHVDNLMAVFDQVYRVLRDDGTLWLNYGDRYSTGGSGEQSQNEHHKQNKGSVKSQPVKGFKPKDLVMMPARIAMAMQERGCADLKAMQMLDRVISEICDEYDGEPIPDKIDDVLDRLYAEYQEAKGNSWYLRSEVVWWNKNCMPESCKDRPTSAHEKVFLLSKQPRYFYDHFAVRTERTVDSIARDYRAYNNAPEVPPGMPKHSGNLFQPRSNAKRQKKDLNPESRKRYPTDEVNGIRDRSGDDYMTGTANLRNVWSIATQSYTGSHFAVMPVALVEPCIKAGTSERGVCGGCGTPMKRIHDSVKTVGWTTPCNCAADIVPAVVLDPFGGSGTVALVAERLGRDAILIEISDEYAELARDRINEDLPPMFSNPVEVE